MATRKKKITNYTIKLTDTDKKAIDGLIDGFYYRTRSQVVRSLPGRFIEAREIIRKREALIDKHEAELAHWHEIRDSFKEMVKLCNPVRK